MAFAAKILIKGLVQGVFFRVRTAQEARKRGLQGYVRNLSNGGVEAWIQGDEVLVNELIDWCRQGPSGARVDSVEITQNAPDLQLTAFDIR